MDWRWLQSSILIEEVERDVSDKVIESNGENAYNGDPINILVEGPDDALPNEVDDSFPNDIGNAPLN